MYPSTVENEISLYLTQSMYHNTPNALPCINNFTLPFCGVTTTGHENKV